MQDAPTDEAVCDEQRDVYRRRFREAYMEAGLSRVESRLFAESDIDVGLLRKLVKAGFSPGQIANQLF